MKEVVVLFVVLGVGLPCLGMPIEVKLAPEADAVLAANLPTNNYGVAGAIAVTGTDTGKLLDSVLRFDAASFVAQMDGLFGVQNWVIQSATLRFNEQRSPNNPLYASGHLGTFEVRWIAADNWTEGTGIPKTPTHDGVCYNNETLTAPLLLGPQDRSLGTSFLNTDWDNTTADYVDVFCSLGLEPSFVTDVRAGGDVSLFLHFSDAALAFQAGSREQKDTTARPYLALVVDQSPEPATLGLLGLGLLGLARRGRRRP